MATSRHGIKILSTVSKTHPEPSIAKSYIKTLTWPQGLHTDTSNSLNYLQNTQQERKTDIETDLKKPEKYCTKQSYFTSFVNKSIDLFYQIPSISKLKGVSYEAITNIHASNWKGSSSKIHSSVPTNGSSLSILTDNSTHVVEDVSSISSRSSVSCEVLKITKAVLEHYTPSKKSRSKSIGCLPDKKIYNYNTQTSTKSNGTEMNYHNNERASQKLRNVESELPNSSGSFEKVQKKHDHQPSEGKSNELNTRYSSSINEMTPVHLPNFSVISAFKNYINQKLPNMIWNCSTQSYTSKRNYAYINMSKQNNLTRQYNLQVRPPTEKCINSSKNLLKHIKRHVRDKSQKRPPIRQQSHQAKNYNSCFDDVKPLLLVLANAKQMAFEMKRLSKPKSFSENNQFINPIVIKTSEYSDHSTVKRNINLKKRDKKSENLLTSVNINREHCNKLNNKRITVEPKKLDENNYCSTKNHDNIDESQNESLKMTNTNFRYPPLKLKKHTSKTSTINENPSTNSIAKLESNTDKPDNPKIKYQPISAKTKRENPTFLKKQDDKDFLSNSSDELSSRIKRDIISENNHFDNNTESNKKNNHIKESIEKDKEKYRGKVEDYLKVAPPTNREIDLWIKKQMQPSQADVISKSNKRDLTYDNKEKRKHADKDSINPQTMKINKENENYVNSLKKPKKGVSKLSLFTSQNDDNTKQEGRITLESLLQSQLKKDEYKSGTDVLSGMTNSPARENNMLNQMPERGLGTDTLTMNYDGYRNRFQDYFQGRLSSFESNTNRIMTDKPDNKINDILQVDKMKTYVTEQEKIPVNFQMGDENNSINRKEPSETLTVPIDKVKSKENTEVKKDTAKHFFNQIEPVSRNNVENKINYKDPFAVPMHEVRDYLNEKYYTIDAAKSKAETSPNLSKFYLEKPGGNKIREFQFYSSTEDIKRSFYSTSDDSFGPSTLEKKIKKPKEKNSIVQNKEPEKKEFSTYEEILRRNQALRNKLIKNRNYKTNEKKLVHKDTVEVKRQSFMEYFVSEFHKKAEWIKEKENNNLKELQRSENTKLAFHEPKNKLQPSELTTKLKNHSFGSATLEKEIKKRKQKISIVQSKEPEKKEFSTYEEILQRNQALRNKLIKDYNYMTNVKKLVHKDTVEVKSQSFMEYFMSEFHKKAEWIKEKENNNLKELQRSENKKLAFHEPKNELQPSELTTKLKNHSSIPEIRNDVIVHRFSYKIYKNKWRYQNEDHSNYWHGTEDKRKFLHNDLLQPNSKRYNQKNLSPQDIDKVSHIKSEKVFKNENCNLNEVIFESNNKEYAKNYDSDSYFKNRYTSFSAPDRKSFKPFIREQAMRNDWPTYEYSIELPKLSSHDFDVNSPTATNSSWFCNTSNISPSMKNIRVSMKPNNDTKL